MTTSNWTEAVQALEELGKSLKGRQLNEALIGLVLRRFGGPTKQPPMQRAIGGVIFWMIHDISINFRAESPVITEAATSGRVADFLGDIGGRLEGLAQSLLRQATPNELLDTTNHVLAYVKGLGAFGLEPVLGEGAELKIESGPTIG